MARRRKDEHAFDDSERRFRALIEHSSDVLLLIDAGGTIIYAAPAVTRAWGYTPGELLGRSLLELIDLNDRDEVQRRLTQLIEHAGTSQVAQYRVRHKDSSWRWMEGVGTNLLAEPSVSAVIINSRDITERKQAEAALRQSERRFRALIENALDIVVLVGADGTIQYASPSVEAGMGLKPEQLVGRSPFDFVHPDDLARVAAEFSRAVSSSGASARTEARFRHRDGSWRALEGVSLNLLDQFGVAGVLVTVRDVTERRRADEEGAALLQIARDISGTLDLEQILARVHRRAAALLPCDIVATYDWDPLRQTAKLLGEHGLPAALLPLVTAPEMPTDPVTTDLLGLGQTIVVDDITAQRWLPPQLLSLFGVSALVMVPLLMHQRRLGALVAARVAPDRGFEPHEVQLLENIAQQVAVAIETTELYRHQQDEARLFAALARVGQALIASLATPVLLDRLCQLTAEVLGCDSSHTLLWRPEDNAYVPVSGFGYSPEEWEGIRVLRLSRTLLARVLARLEDEEVVRLDLTAPATPTNPELAALAQQYRITQALAVTLRRGGEIIGLQIAVQRGPRPQFAEQQERLARGVAQLASMALENARLVEELEQANRVKSEFVAAMSHELRTPLNIITGYIGLLRDQAFGALSGEQPAILAKVDQSAQDLLELIATTLDLSRLQAGRMAVAICQCDPVSLLAELEDETHHLQQKPGLQFAWQVPGGLPRLQTDPLKLKVVLKNLITNAVKFTDRGSITVAAATADGGVGFSVTDTGVGMSAEVLPIIFEPFRQAHGPLSHGRGGVGLGLHIASRLLELLGGSITVESEVGRGSTFRVWVPRQWQRLPQ
ncbi:MAG: PAS domain S-box protein [Deltaproteobacteria bacterium]|nr:PAS domain S-box protein [Deltaproteobacteria bacterium]